ncbi:MepB family protein [Gammaproteobacteria bacterium]|nr:MepB family protein [Gammaproteobacteria bacterium]
MPHYNESDSIDFVVVAVSDGNNVGVFVFPKTILTKKNIFSANGKEGKREIRVYAPWDKTTSTQAAKTQKWQGQFFVDLNSSCSESTLKINNLYSM